VLAAVPVVTCRKQEQSIRQHPEAPAVEVPHRLVLHIRLLELQALRGKEMPVEMDLTGTKHSKAPAVEVALVPLDRRQADHCSSPVMVALVCPTLFLELLSPMPAAVVEALEAGSQAQEALEVAVLAVLLAQVRAQVQASAAVVEAEP
jgi:hypothetical protein